MVAQLSPQEWERYRDMRFTESGEVIVDMNVTDAQAKLDDARVRLARATGPLEILEQSVYLAERELLAIGLTQLGGEALL